MALECTYLIIFGTHKRTQIFCMHWKYYDSWVKQKHCCRHFSIWLLLCNMDDISNETPHLQIRWWTRSFFDPVVCDGFCATLWTERKSVDRKKNDRKGQKIAPMANIVLCEQKSKRHCFRYIRREILHRYIQIHTHQCKVSGSRSPIIDIWA